METVTDVLVRPTQVVLASSENLGQVLLDKIATRQATLAVIGVGYVGLPLAIGFAESGLNVVGIDIDVRKVASLGAGHSYIGDVSDERLRAVLGGNATLVAQPLAVPATVNGNGNGNGNGNVNGVHTNGVHTNGVHTNGVHMNGAHANGAEAGSNGHVASDRPARGAFRATTDFGALREADAVIICVPTPVNQVKEPDLSFIISAVEHIAENLHRGMLVMLESTTYPGTTEEAVLPRLEATGLRLGQDYFLGFSPERIDPGRTDWTVHNTPKVVSGMTPRCLEMAQALYGCAIQNLVPVTNPKTAEMVKLYENTFRAVNIGMANEMAIICERMGIDVWEVIAAAATKPYGFTAFFPGPGIGGHCIPVDPLYLSWKLQAFNYRARFIETADDINSAMPAFVRDLVMNALNDDGKALKGARVLVMGVAYKADIDDVRESPSLELIHLLKEKGARVEFCDPHVSSIRIGGHTMTGVPFGPETLEWADCVVIATAHRAFDWRLVLDRSQLVVDTRNATNGCAPSRARVIKL